MEAAVNVSTASCHESGSGRVRGPGLPGAGKLLQRSCSPCQVGLELLGAPQSRPDSVPVPRNCSLMRHKRHGHCHQWPGCGGLLCTHLSSLSAAPLG